jgi:glycosyltransferase involved in cell wall biosynthesis
MKVALDATPLLEPTGGIRRYTLELAAALSREFPEDEILLVSDQAYQQPDLLSVRFVQVSSQRWWSQGLPAWLRAEQIDVFHGTDFAVPYLPVRPSVMTVHDLSPWRLQGSNRVRLRTPALLHFGLATMVVTPSESVRREAIAMFHLQPEEVATTPLAASPHFRPIHLPPPERPYFLYVGTIEPRKNLQVALEAWRPLRCEADFLIAGRARKGHEIAPEPGLRRLGAVPEIDLPMLYSQSLAVVYPSLYEGFGLPVLEAMQCGALVITSKDSAVTETACGACLQVDPQGWPEAMRAVLNDPCLRTTYQHKALARAAEFSWQQTARLTHAVYAKALRRFHG